jgi:YggT family protein
MAIQTLRFVLETLFQLFAMAVLVRFYAQLVRAPFRARAGNPLVDFIFGLTDWIVLPMRKVIPSIGRIDVASFLVAWLVLAILTLIVFTLVGVAKFASPFFWPGLLIYSLVEVLKVSLYVLMGVMIIEAVMSWFSPYHPLRPLFGALSAPFLRPLRRVIPLIGGVDISPLILLIVIQVLLMLPVQFMSQEALRLATRTVLPL